MARKRHKDLNPGLQPGDPYFIPWDEATRRAHAEALMRSHEGHRCAPRADALCGAGEYYALLGEHDVAEPLFKEALGIEGGEPGRAHGYYAAFLFDQGRADEALELIAQARRLRPESPEVFEFIGEVLIEHDYPQEAFRWLTAGMVRRHGSLTDVSADDLRYDFDLRMLAQLRQSAREMQDMAPDHIDEMVEEIRRERAPRR